MAEVDPSKNSSFPPSQASALTPADDSAPNAETGKKGKSSKPRSDTPNYSKEDGEALLEIIAQVECPGANYLAEVGAKYAELQIRGPNY